MLTCITRKGQYAAPFFFLILLSKTMFFEKNGEQRTNADSVHLDTQVSRWTSLPVICTNINCRLRIVQMVVSTVNYKFFLIIHPLHEPE